MKIMCSESWTELTHESLFNSLNFGNFKVSILNILIIFTISIVESIIKKERKKK